METPDAHPASLIQSIEIDDLFGQFRYFIRSPASLNNDNKLLLLYGDNGAGKSTILNVVFHLLHPEPYGGHRTEVAQIPFGSVRISLTSGYLIVATKDEPFDQTKYTIQLFYPDSRGAIEYTWEYENRKRENTDPDYLQYCEVLKEIGVAFHFLSDTRRVAGASEDSDEEPLVRLFRTRINRDDHPKRLEYGRTTTDAEVLVGDAVNRTIEGLRQLALTGTSEGYTSVNTIYENLISEIIDLDVDTDHHQDSSINELRRNLENLRKRNSNYAKYGLTSELSTQHLLEQLSRAQGSHIKILNTVLKPYFDGHHARLNALQSVQKVIDEFVTLLSEFFSLKSVELDVRTGLSIVDNRDMRIPPEALSSGERQLVVLLCNAITARQDGMILVIDEPEISLNIKWQRRLIAALLTCLEGVDMQIVLATHSVEILSQYQNYVTSLESSADSIND